MKKILYLLFVTVLLLGIYNCSEDSPVVATTTVATTTIPLTTATISGVGSLPAGTAGSIQNTQVALYNSVDDWAFFRTFKFTACDGNGNYIMAVVVPGVYFMDAWKDNDNDGVWGSSGDFIWWNGSGAWPATFNLAPRQFPLGTNTVDFVIILVP